MLEVGLEGRATLLVGEEHTAGALGSGLVDGLGTPAMIGLMEAAAVRSTEGEIVEGSSSVGTRVDVAHTAPTSVGMTLTAHARLTEVEGRRLVFAVRAEDEAGEVGRGIHERWLIDVHKFNEKLALRGR